MPLRGQRTWTNAWTVYRVNTILKTYKIKLLKNLYSLIPNSELNSIYLAEQVNLLWKLQWESEWNEAKRKRLLFLNKNKIKLKVDLNLMSNLIVSNSKKKKKSTLKKNVFTLGFEPGFTKTILKTSILNKY